MAPKKVSKSRKLMLVNIDSHEQLVDQEGGAKPKKNFKGSPFIRNTPEYDIILKLGRIKGYDENKRILGSDGKYIHGSDISMLLNEAMSPKRVLNGMDDFIKLLAKAKIDPDIILNDTIKSKLVAYKRRSDNTHNENRSIPADEIRPTSEETRTNIRNNQPSINLERINLDDYRHLLGRGRKSQLGRSTKR